MIDVTATMLPRTVMNDRSLAAQIASSAIIADSKYLFMASTGQEGQEGHDPSHLSYPSCPSRPSCLSHPSCPSPDLLLRVDLHLVAVLHAAHRIVGAGDDLVGG